MAIKYLTSIDLNANEVQNAKAHVLASDPGTPVAGQFWYRSDTGLLSFENATVAIRLGRLDQITAPTAAVSLNSQLITNLATPVSVGDAATKAYVDGLVGGGVAWKNPVRLASTANGALATAFANAQNLDGVALVTGDRILIKDQTAPAENGIYTVNAAGAPTRSSDADLGTEMVGATTFVLEGSTQADLAYTCTNTGTITLNTTGLTFVQISALGQISAGTGLTKTLNSIDVVGTANRIVANANSIDIDAAYIGQTTITTLGTVAFGTWNATTIAVGKGGTGATSLTANGVLLGGATVTALGTTGTTAQVLHGAAGAPTWGSVALGTDVSGTLPVGSGGIGVGTLLVHGLLVGNTTSAVTVLGVGTTGQTLKGVTAADPAWTTTKYAADIAGGSTSEVITHGLNTKDVHVVLFDNTTPWSEVMVQVGHTSTTTVTLFFAVAPSAAQYRVVVMA